jgi:hypothetical protein
MTYTTRVLKAAKLGKGNGFLPGSQVAAKKESDWRRLGQGNNINRGLFPKLMLGY